jgi:PPOX class probable F420-dependent enzyme
MKPATDRPLRQSERTYLVEHPVGRLATIDPRGRPHAVPVCYAVSDDVIVMSLDNKPKSVSPRDLQRVRNLQARSEVALVVDDYSDDWRQLSWVMARGNAKLVDVGAPGHAAAIQLLREKYPQYLSMPIDLRPIIQIDVTSATSWSWDGRHFPED